MPLADTVCSVRPTRREPTWRRLRAPRLESDHCRHVQRQSALDHPRAAFCAHCITTKRRKIASSAQVLHPRCILPAAAQIHLIYDTQSPHPKATHQGMA